MKRTRRRISPLDETGHWKIFAVLAVGEEFIAAHDCELWEGPGAVRSLPLAAGRATAGPAEDHAPDHSRIRGALARARAGKELDCAETGGATVFFQVLRTRRNDQGESGTA